MTALNTPESPQHPDGRRKRSSWEIQLAVWGALYQREMKTRFGVYRLGYLWALIEPVSHIVVLSFIFSFVAREGYQGIGFGPFFAAGIIPFFIFQKTITFCTNSIQSNEGLFSYRQVRPMDTIVVRSFIELVTSLATLVFLVWFGYWFLNYEIYPKAPLEFLGLMLLFFIGSLGMGLISSVVGALSEETGKFIPQVLRPLYFISGIMMPIQALPPSVHPYLLWNPLLHGIEQLRAYTFSGYDPGPTSTSYFFIWAILSLAIGLWYFGLNRTRIMM